MSQDPAERLEALRREVEGAAAARPVGPEPPASGSGSPPPPSAEVPPRRGSGTPGDAIPGQARRVSGVVEDVVDATGTGRPAGSGGPRDAWRGSPGGPRAWRGAPGAPGAPGSWRRYPGDQADGQGWSINVALGGAGFRGWFGIGLLVVGGYLVLAQVVPGIAFIGSAVLLVGGLALLGMHFTARASGWALYAGALLTSIGAARVLASMLPGSLHGVTPIAIGIAFLAIAWLRHSQGGGYGWQGKVGVFVAGYGLLELALGLLPGSPGVLDFLLPGLLVLAGAVVLMRALQRPAGP